MSKNGIFILLLYFDQKKKLFPSFRNHLIFAPLNQNVNIPEIHFKINKLGHWRRPVWPGPTYIFFFGTPFHLLILNLSNKRKRVLTAVRFVDQLSCPFIFVKHLQISLVIVTKEWSLLFIRLLGKEIFLNTLDTMTI